MKSQVYSELFSSKMSSAGVWDVDGNEVAEGDAGEAVAVMMERRETVDEGTAVAAFFLAFLLKKTIK